MSKLFRKTCRSKSKMARWKRYPDRHYTADARVYSRILIAQLTNLCFFVLRKDGDAVWDKNAKYI